MAVNFKVVEGNTAPNYVITCTRKKVALDLTDVATVTLIIQRKSDKVITQAGKNATITDAANGIITYTADATDHSPKGDYVGDVKLTYNGGGIEILRKQATWNARAKISA